MSRACIRRLSITIFACAALTGSGAVFPSAASAEPPCLQWNISSPGQRAVIVQSNGYNVFFDFDQTWGRNYFRGPARIYGRPGVRMQRVTASGQFFQVDKLRFRLTFSNASFSDYWGRVVPGSPPRLVEGGTGPLGRSLATWQMQSPIQCARHASIGGPTP